MLVVARFKLRCVLGCVEEGRVGREAGNGDRAIHGHPGADPTQVCALHTATLRCEGHWYVGSQHVGFFTGDENKRLQPNRGRAHQVGSCVCPVPQSSISISLPPHPIAELTGHGTMSAAAAIHAAWSPGQHSPCVIAINSGYCKLKT